MVTLRLQWREVDGLVWRWWWNRKGFLKINKETAVVVVLTVCE